MSRPNVPDPSTDAQGFVRHLLKVNHGKVPEQLLLPADPKTQYNVRHALLTEAQGLSFSEATAAMKRDHSELALACGLGLPIDD